MFGLLVGAGLAIAGTAVAIHHRRCGRRAVMGHVFRRLKATEDQRRQWTALRDETHTRLSAVKDRLRTLRREVADILAAPAIDTQRLDAVEAQMFDALREGGRAAREAVTRTHETLNPQQRAQVAEWMRRSLHHRHHCRPAMCAC